MAAPSYGWWAQAPPGDVRGGGRPLQPFPGLRTLLCAGILWNLSSSDNLKDRLARDTLEQLTDLVLVPLSGLGGSGVIQQNPSEAEIFYNSTGFLRYLPRASSGPSIAGEGLGGGGGTACAGHLGRKVSRARFWGPRPLQLLCIKAKPAQPRGRGGGCPPHGGAPWQKGVGGGEAPSHRDGPAGTSALPASRPGRRCASATGWWTP